MRLIELTACLNTAGVEAIWVRPENIERIQQMKDHTVVYERRWSGEVEVLQVTNSAQSIADRIEECQKKTSV
jgi:uncharacterized protein YlzI (FlbEa/FlbD family)